MNEETLVIEQILEESSLIDVNKKRDKRRFSKLCWGVFAIIFSMQFLSMIPDTIVTMLENANILSADYHQWIVVICSAYVIGFPIFYIITSKISVKENIAKPLVMTPMKFIMYLIVASGFAYFFNFIASFLNLGLLSLFNLPSFDLLQNALNNTNLLGNIAYVVIIGPIMEELIYRKLIIDRIKDYGQLLPIIFSAVIFGLMHGNFTQTIYATALGLVLGFIYVKYDNIKYCILIHMIFNSLSTIVFSYIITNEIAIAIIYITIILITAVYLYLNRKKITFEKGNLNLTMKEKLKIAFLNGGFVAVSIISLIVIIIVFFILAII